MPNGSDFLYGETCMTNIKDYMKHLWTYKIERSKCILRSGEVGSDELSMVSLVAVLLHWSSFLASWKKWYILKIFIYKDRCIYLNNYSLLRLLRNHKFWFVILHLSQSFWTNNDNGGLQTNHDTTRFSIVMVQESTFEYTSICVDILMKYRTAVWYVFLPGATHGHFC